MKVYVPEIEIREKQTNWLDRLFIYIAVLLKLIRKWEFSVS